VFDSLTDRFTWIPLNTFEQKCAFLSTIRYSKEEVRDPKKGCLEIVTIQREELAVQHATHPDMIAVMGAPKNFVERRTI
jgi:hypothetical protein